MTKETFIKLFRDFVPLQNKEDFWSFVKFMSDKIKPVHVLEIGLEYGGSSRVLAQFCEENYGRFVGMDLNPVRARCMLSLLHCPNYYVQGDSTDKNIVYFAKKLIDETPEKSFDLIFIDGDQDNIDKDLNNYYPMLRKGGVIAFTLRQNTLNISNKELLSTDRYTSPNGTIFWFIKE